MSGEFERIAQFFKPLAREPFALGLSDDAALLSVPAGRELVVTTDTLVAGVHFFAEDAPADIARKALRVNLSDLAAKGASPFVYTLVLALPAAIDDRWLAAFAAALGEDQRRYDIGLIGGDMSATPGPLSITIGAFGLVPQGSMLKRHGARPGDLLFVTGTIGDAALGLLVARGELTLPSAAREYLHGRYLRPQPRHRLGPLLCGLASAAMDVSDGLLADAGHLARAAQVDLVIDSAALPLSPAAQSALAEDPRLLETLVSGGDDYEILFTAPPSAMPELERVAAEAGVSITAIGEVRAPDATGAARVIDKGGRRIETSGAGGWRHW